MTSDQNETPLKPHHRDVLASLLARTDDRSPDPGMMTSGATFADSYNVWVNWRTAQLLHRRGLVTYPYIGSGGDDGTSIALTEAGRAIAEAPR